MPKFLPRHTRAHARPVRLQPLAWIYGHSHRNVPEFRIGETRMLTNQFGYVQFGGERGFRRDAVVDVNADVLGDSMEYAAAQMNENPALAEKRIGHDPPAGSSLARTFILKIRNGVMKTMIHHE